MRKLFIALCCAAAGHVCAQSFYPVAEGQKFAATPRGEVALYDFPLKDVALTDGVFRNAMMLDAKWLLNLKPDRFLHRFHKFAGLPVKGEIYGGWESENISGHTLGHYLSACAMQYAATQDVRFKEIVDYTVSELAKCQAHYTGVMTGYVGGIPEQERIFTEISEGKLYSSGFDLNGGWVPLYTQHKLFAGLMDAYLHTGNKQALDVVCKLADWMVNLSDRLTDEQFQQMLQCEFGGMNDSMYVLYTLTGDERYLKLAGRFYHKAVLDPLAARQDRLNGMHANTIIPKIIGCATGSWVTASDSLYDIADYFWHTVVEHHSYANGGNSNFERFTPVDEISEHLSSNSTETCNTYNMLKLSKKLFAFTADSRYMDYYERALYNHILASQHSKTGMVVYYLNHLNGGHKAFSSPFDAFWCCVGTGLENHVKYGEAIYNHTGKKLYVNLFIPSTLDWEDENVRIEQHTSFPFTDRTQLRIAEGRKKHFSLYIRKPSWLAAPLEVEVNGERLSDLKEEKGYVVLDRKWKAGDVVDVRLPMKMETVPAPDKEECRVFMYGPVLLANVLAKDRDPLDSDPVIVADRSTDYMQLMDKADLSRLEFVSDRLSDNCRLNLRPLFSVNDEDYALYMNFFTPARWKAEKVKYEERKKREKEIRSRMVDEIRFEMQSERDHRLVGEKTNAGMLNTYSWRDAVDGGYFEFEMSTQQRTDLSLLARYWGRDGGNRSFRIEVDGTAIAEVTLNDTGKNEVYEVEYPIPADLLENKDKIKIRFQANPRQTAGGVFGCRLVRQNAKD